jgi:N-acetylglucosaminyl-diphospho-decaprenol L-rhamnosyltransferase
VNGAARPGPPPPRLSGIAVHWRDEASLAGLLGAWPRDPRFELVVVDNGSGGPLPAPPDGARVRVVSPGRNLGFAGGANRGAREAAGDLLLLLNADARPEPGALEALLDGFAAHPEAAGLAPRLEGPAGEPQWRWQLKGLPGPGRLVLEALFLPAASGPRDEPRAGAPVAQPAAAALALRRRAWEAVGGMDARFFPAWFEDVDLARRLREAGSTVLYWPAARFRHGLGSSVPRLGFGSFLWLYYRNLTRYLARHHGRGWAAAARLLLPVGMALRLVLLPVRKPRRAASRREAAAALVAVAVGATSGWRRPAGLAREWAYGGAP